MFFCFYEEDSGLSDEGKKTGRERKNGLIVFFIGKFKQALRQALRLPEF